MTELLRNARDSGAGNIYVSSVLRRRRYRNLTVIDDGSGIPDPYKDLIFEPGVTSRHLNPTLDTGLPGSTTPHGAGLSLYHINTLALDASVSNPASPTAISITLDTEVLPERALQSDTRPSRSNLLATTRSFAQATPHINFYYSSPAKIFATLLHSRIILLPDSNSGDKSTAKMAKLRERAESLGLSLSEGTVSRVLSGRVGSISALDVRGIESGGIEEPGSGRMVGGPTIKLDSGDVLEIEGILARVARSHYLGVQNLRSESRPGEIILRANIYEPEDEYDA